MPASDIDISGQLAAALAAYLRAIEATVSAAVTAAVSAAPPRASLPAPPPRTPIVEDTDRPPLLVSAREGARMLGVSKGTLFNWSAPRGPIPVVKIGSRTCYAVSDLEAAILRLKVQPARRTEINPPDAQ